MTDSDEKKGDPLAALMIEMCASAPSIHPRDVAQVYFARHRKKHERDDGWNRYMIPIRQTAVSLARNGKLVILRKGVVADPDDFRGLYRIALPPVE